MNKAKVLLSVLSVLMLMAPSVSLADTTLTPASNCTIPPDHGVWADDGHLTLLGCIKSDIWNAAINAQAHGTNLPVFFYPKVVTDQYGIPYPCEEFLVHGCVDPTAAPGYDTYIRTLGKELVSNGYHAGDFGGRFDKLMSAVR